MNQRTSMWKVIVLAVSMVSSSFLFVFMTGISTASAGTYEKIPSHTYGMIITDVQETPTVDPTVTTLEKEKLTQEVAQQQHTLENLFWNNTVVFLSILAVVIGLIRWRADRRDEQKRRREDHLSEQKKRDEERFQTVVTGLGSKETEVRVGAAIILRTFLQNGYEQFYIQVFDLAVAHLRLRKADSGIPVPLDSLSQALITVFKKSFRLAHSMNKQEEFLDAARIQLDNAYLVQADLQHARLEQSSLREAHLEGAHLEGAYLEGAHLEGAHLEGAYFEGAYLERAYLERAHLEGAHLEDAHSLQGTSIRAAIGLMPEQIDACVGKGASI